LTEQALSRQTDIWQDLPSGIKVKVKEKREAFWTERGESEERERERE
jgi:hypothetical protein